MEQRISLITLGVADITRARAFYERLGWQGQEAEETVFFQAGDMALILWDRAKLAADSGVADSGVADSGVADHGPGGFDGVVLAHNVRSRAEVDTLMADAAAAGAEITQPTRETFYGGYAGCFRDPDGHVWEIAWNPGFTLAPDGSLVLPDFS
jgi:predicted lactoylglutathione lyase